MNYNVYCDESCHLIAQGGPLVLGAIKIDASKRYAYRDAIRAIKAKHGMPTDCEMKWTRISSSKLEAYLDLVKFFFENEGITFRALVAPNRDLTLDKYGLTYDDWYYRMYFYMLSPFLSNEGKTRIYLDIKDTRGIKKVSKLHDVLCCKEMDFDHEIIEKVQEIRSHEVELMSLVDVLIGAISYVHRGLGTSNAKLKVVEAIRSYSKLSLERTTLYSASKFNLFVWRPGNV